MGYDVHEEATHAAELLRAWSVGDFDGFAESLQAITDPGQELAEHLREQEGDARAIQQSIEVELENLAELVRGSLYLVRRAIDLLLDPPGERFVSREEALARLLSIHERG